MSLPLETTTVTTISKETTAPFYLVEIGFDTPNRLTSWSSPISWAGYTWMPASMNIRGGQRPSITIFNETLVFGAQVLGQKMAGRTIRIWKSHREDTLSEGFGEVVPRFDGLIEDAGGYEYIEIKCEPRPPSTAPSFMAEAPWVNHAPQPGTRIETPKQIIILE